MKRKKVLALIMAAAMTFGTVSTAFAMDTNKYKDVLATEDFFKYVEDVVDLKIMEGETADEFGVKEDVTREDVVSYMYKMMKSPAVNGSLEFSDVADKDYADAVIWADKEKLFDGMREGFFAENNFSAETGVTRAEMCQIMKNLAEKKLKIDVKEDVAENLDAYEDSKDVHEEYVEAVKWAVGNKLLAEREDAAGKLLSNEVINKVETAEFLSKLMDMVEDETVDIVGKEETQGSVTNKPEEPNKPNKPANTDKPSNPAKPENGTKPGDNQEEAHEHKWIKKEYGEEGHWVDNLIKDAWEETIEHKEEGHMETIVIQPEYTQEVPVSAEIGHSERVTVVDKEAWTEEIKHPEEGHMETIVDKEAWEETIHHEAVVENKWVVDKEAKYETVHHPAVTENKWVVDKEAWTEEIKHPAVTENKWVEDKPAWVEEIKHPEEGHNEIRNICHNCGADITGHAMEHITNPENISNGCMSYGNKEVWIVDKEAWTETVKHPAEGHYEDVVVKPAWTETVKHPEEGHYEEVVIKEAWDETVLVSPEEGHYEEVVIKEAWDEVIKHPAETHEEWVVDKEAWTEYKEHPAETHEEFQWVVDVPAVTEFVKVPAETEDKWVVDKEAWTEVVKHEAEYEKVWVVDKEAYTEIICSVCGESKDKK